ncbi:hypothetical protein N7507_006595 [Penicillium longicatenatum]|nr:hypothetical protein N7507_006595 [Penicillium longicatenatum]
MDFLQTQTHAIVFVAHSLGGSLVKSALVFSDQEQEDVSSRLDIISALTRGVFFMDTTELGISTNGMEKLLHTIEGSDQENSDSCKEAKWLLGILKQYVSLSAKYRNVYVSPRRGSETIQKPETESPEDPGYLKIKAELLDILKVSCLSARHISWEK